MLEVDGQVLQLGFNTLPLFIDGNLKNNYENTNLVQAALGHKKTSKAPYSDQIVSPQSAKSDEAPNVYKTGWPNDKFFRQKS